MPRIIPLSLLALAALAPAARASDSHVDGRCTSGLTAFSQTSSAGPAATG
jgi:hypothetical protein